MKLALIPPVKNIEYSRLSDMDFALADIALDNPEYAMYYHDRPKDRFLIMDNGAYELGVPLPTDTLMKAAKLLRADEIVASDYPFKPRKTIKATREFLDSLSSGERRMYKVMYVPHGATTVSWVNSYKAAKNIDCDTIGLSILLDKKFIARKLLFFTALDMDGMVDKEHHLLGLDDPRELQGYKTFNIRSVDTSLPFSRAKHNLSITDTWRPKLYKRIDLLQDDLTTQYVQVQKNVKELLQYLPTS